MSDQLSDAQNSGFDPYAHARQKQAAAVDREAAQGRAEADIIAQYTDLLAETIADDEDQPGTWQTLVDCAAIHSVALYRKRAVTALSVMAPIIAERSQSLDLLRDHLLAEATRLEGQRGRQLTAEDVAARLREIVEATR